MPTRLAVTRPVLLLAGLMLLLASPGCRDRPLRGELRKSPDGRTYLVVADDNGGACGPIHVDGQRWPHALHVPGAVTPGRHVIRCGGEVEVEVPAGMTFRFDYWGP